MQDAKLKGQRIAPTLYNENTHKLEWCMRFEPVSSATAAAFSCRLCAEAQSPDAFLRERWYQENKASGAGYFVLLDDEDQIVGKCQTAPIPLSPLEGRNLLVILCLYVHMYEQDVGDQRDQGYGGHMLAQVEEIAKQSGYQGVAVWAMDWTWNPVSFYLHHGYQIADRVDKVVAAWKPFTLEAVPPRILRYTLPPALDLRKVQVVVVDNGFCNGYAKRNAVRAAIRGIEEMVEYVDAPRPYMGRMVHLGQVGGVFLDGEAYRPYALIGNPDDLREEIVRRYTAKG